MEIDEAINEYIKTKFCLTTLPILNKVNDLTKGEVFVLNYLLENRHSASPKEISDMMMVSTARIAAMLNDLESKKYIKRVHSNEDRRKVDVVITEDGICLIKKKIEELKKILFKLFEKLGENDATEFIRIEKKIVLILQEIKNGKKETCNV